jgi:hypothetical protein
MSISCLCKYILLVQLIESMVHILCAEHRLLFDLFLLHHFPRLLINLRLSFYFLLYFHDLEFLLKVDFHSPFLFLLHLVLEELLIVPHCLRLPSDATLGPMGLSIWDKCTLLLVL